MIPQPQRKPFHAAPAPAMGSPQSPYEEFYNPQQQSQQMSPPNNWDNQNYPKQGDQVSEYSQIHITYNIRDRMDVLSAASMRRLLLLLYRDPNLWRNLNLGVEENLN